MARDENAIPPRVLSCSTITGDKVVNAAGEDLGEIEELMIDLESGRVAYAVLSFGGFLGIGDKLFAVPFEALELDAEHERFVLDVPREKLEKAPGFDKSSWPDFADPRFGQQVYGYYDITAYW
jgi:sporulation protein YlmC with PRC-barrel domain